MKGDVHDHVLIHIVTNQSEQIRLQNEAIDELFGVLGRYMSAEELDRLPCIKKIDEAVKLHKEIGDM